MPADKPPTNQRQRALRGLKHRGQRVPALREISIV